MGNFVTASPNEAVMISGLRGTRVRVGQTGWKWWIVETKESISLQLIPLELHSHKVETVQGVCVDVTAVATVKIKSGLKRNEAGRVLVDAETILVAGQQFGGKTQEQINDLLKACLEGHQRQILGTLTVEQIFKDRASFSNKVREHVHEDLEKMGMEVISYSIKAISDENGYMASLGATQVALVKREAAEGEAKNTSEAKQKVAQAEAIAKIASSKYERVAHVAATEQMAQQLIADQSLELKRAETQLQIGEARERAQAAVQLVKEQQQQEVIRQRTEQRFIEREVETKIAQEEARRVQAEMEGQSLAKLKMAENDAKSVIVQAQAEAERIRLLAAAEADATRARGKAEADNLMLQARAYNEFGEAALAQLLINKLPEIAAEIARPLAQTEKITFVSNGGGEGGGPSALTRDLTSMLGQLPESVHALTGFDLRTAIQNTKKNKDKPQQIAEVQM